MLGFAEARRPMKAPFALTLLLSEPPRFMVATHYQERTRGFAVQIILEGRGDQGKVNKIVALEEFLKVDSMQSRQRMIPVCFAQHVCLVEAKSQCLGSSGNSEAFEAHTK